MTYDLILHGGEVIDGAGRPRFRADVAIHEDRIAHLGDLAAAAARRRIDVTGKIVAPGFVDVHNHSDGWLPKLGNLKVKTLQGFTTEVVMSDGISYAPVNEHTVRQWFYYLRALDGLRMDEYGGWRSLEEFAHYVEGKSAQNFQLQIPYANVRSLVCGFGRGPVDDFQIRRIEQEITRGMESGAVGLSTGLDYIVQCYATTDELVQACSAVAPYGGIYATHVRYKTGLLPGIREAVEIGKRSGAKVHISHLKGQSPREVEEVLEYIDTTARKEVDFSFDAYPYQCGSTMLTYLLPYEAWEKGPLAMPSKLADPVIRARMREGLGAYRLDLDHIQIAWTASKGNRHLLGMTLDEVIAQKGAPAEETLTDLLLEEGGAVLLVFLEGDDQLVEPLLAHDLCVIGSDGIYCEDGPVHPRVFGTAGRILGQCVRDRRLFSLEDAVHRLTGRPAKRFGLAGRGILTEGAFADVTVFDPLSIRDEATYQQPRQYPHGVEHVLVNGTLIVENGAAMTETRQTQPGVFVRFDPTETATRLV